MTPWYTFALLASLGSALDMKQIDKGATIPTATAIGSSITAEKTYTGQWVKVYILGLLKIPSVGFTQSLIGQDQATKSLVSVARKHESSLWSGSKVETLAVSENQHLATASSDPITTTLFMDVHTSVATVAAVARPSTTGERQATVAHEISSTRVQTPQERWTLKSDHSVSPGPPYYKLGNTTSGGDTSNFCKSKPNDTTQCSSFPSTGILPSNISIFTGFSVPVYLNLPRYIMVLISVIPLILMVLV